MAISKQHFLLVLICSLIVESQVLSPITNCLGNCLTCDPLSLTECQGSQACEWGYYDPLENGTCLPAPTTKVVSSQLEQKEDKSLASVAPGWSDSARLAVCQYLSPHGTKFMDVLGFYEGVQMLQKTFQVDPSSQIFYFSFNLLRDEWLPFNDFMIIDVSTGNKNLQTLEISYDRRITLDSQPAAITCGGKRVLSQKFSITVENNGKIGKTLSFLFTSFLYSSTWGLTNVELVSGCKSFSLYNDKAQKCNLCDKDSFLAKVNGAEVCQKCPNLCSTCESKDKCLTCLSGAALDNNSNCVFPQNSKTQSFNLGQNFKVCGTTPLKIGSLTSPIILPELRNDNDLLYDQIQVGFMVYYLPSEWAENSKEVIHVYLNKIQIMEITWKNLTNLGTDECESFQARKTAKIQLFSDKIVHTDNVVQLEFKLGGTNEGLQFGISDIRIKSLKKIMEASQTSLDSQPEKDTTVTQTENQLNGTQQVELNEQTENNETSLPAEADKVDPIQLQDRVIDERQRNESIIVQPVILPEKTEPQEIQEEHIENEANQTQERTEQYHLITVEEEKEEKQEELQPQPNNIQEKSEEEEKEEEKKEEEPEPFPVSPLPQSIPSQNSSFPNSEDDHTIEDPQIEDSPNMAYLPTVSDKKSGLQVFIKNEPEQDHLYKVHINKLNPDQYKIDSYYLEDNKLNMFITIDKSFTQGTVSVYRYSTSRLLQQSNDPVLVGAFKVTRFDSLSQNQIESVQSFSYLFNVVAWVGVIGIIIAVMSGYGVVVEEYVLTLQIIFLHVYIASDYLPVTFRDVVGGLNIIENLNFFLPTHSESIQNQWMGNVLQNGPVRFYLFNKDINFLREFYPIIIINIVYLIWFILLSLGRFYLNKDLIDEQKTFFHRFLDNVVGRVINFWDQIWRYQFLATIWFCFIQFYNFAYPENSNRSEGINTAICILAFLCSLAWPIFISFYCRKQYYDDQYSEFLYNYEDIYYLKIPQYELPSNHHRFGYPLLKTVKIVVIALTICYLGNIATLTLLVLISVHILQLVYIHKQEVYSNQKYFTLRIIENGIFVLIELILVGMLNFSSLAVSESYIYIGYILAAVAFLGVVNGFVRMGYLGYNKYKQLKEDFLSDNLQDQQKKPKTQRVV